MKRQFVICSVLLFSASLPLCAQLAASHEPTSAADAFKASVTLQSVGKPVAKVNGAVLTDHDLVREMFAIFPYAKQHNGNVPKTMEEQIRRGALQMIEFEELVYQEALRRKMTVPPLKLKKAEADFRKQFSSPEEYQEFLKQECQNSRQVLRARIRRSLLIDAVLKTEVDLKAVVSLAEAKAYYDKNPGQFAIRESYAIQTISVFPPPNATPAQLKEADKRAQEACKQAKATKNYEEFGMLAEKISDDDWRVMMGDHRSVDQHKVTAEVWNVLKKMQPGQVSDLIKIGQAYTIVRLNARIGPGTQKFELVKDGLRKQLRQKKTEQLRSALDRRLRQNAKVEEL